MGYKNIPATTTELIGNILVFKVDGVTSGFTILPPPLVEGNTISTTKTV